MKSRSYRFAVLVTALILVAMSASQFSFSADHAPVAVKIDNFSFSPQTITVAVGTEVIWTNQDDIPHTVVSDDKTTFKSKALDTEDKFSFTFSKPGTYPYFCSIHPKISGQIVVQ